jgi:phosphoglycolate phosphatase
MLTLLFDIDGTLVRTGGAGKAAMEAALRNAFGITDIRDEVPYSGRTDPAIGGDLLRVHGLEVTHENYLKLSNAYLASLPGCMSRIAGEVCPGIPKLLNTLREKNRTLGLLTGNVQAGAKHKLTHFGLWEYFAFGGFGDEHHDRDDVARSALRAAAERQANATEVWVIGDTPLDVKCARAIGAKAIAVATGWHPIQELHATGAELVLHDLSDFAQLPASWFRD